MPSLLNHEYNFTENQIKKHIASPEAKADIIRMALNLPGLWSEAREIKLEAKSSVPLSGSRISISETADNPSVLPAFSGLSQVQRWLCGANDQIAIITWAYSEQSNT